MRQLAQETIGATGTQPLERTTLVGVGNRYTKNAQFFNTWCVMQLGLYELYGARNPAPVAGDFHQDLAANVEIEKCLYELYGARNPAPIL